MSTSSTPTTTTTTTSTSVTWAPFSPSFCGIGGRATPIFGTPAWSASALAATPTSDSVATSASAASPLAPAPVTSAAPAPALDDALVPPFTWIPPRG
ncbi:hypothetical protein BGW39_004064, partial [Mortierella sp. 14UC]